MAEGAGLEPTQPEPKAGGLPLADPSLEPIPGIEPDHWPYKGQPAPRPTGVVRSVGFEPTLYDSSSRSLYRWGTCAWSLRAALNRLPPLYESGALPGELQRHDSSQVFA